LLTDFLDHLIDLFVRDQGQNRTLQGCDKGWEHEVGARSLVGADAEAMLKDAVNDATDTEGGLDN